MNEGAGIMYYSGHGTGGSGISAQYVQTEHSEYPEQVWWMDGADTCTTTGRHHETVVSPGITRASKPLRHHPLQMGRSAPG